MVDQVVLLTTQLGKNVNSEMSTSKWIVVTIVRTLKAWMAKLVEYALLARNL